jgi:pimeloyl-ACP methyl ester carboxylesterase
MFFGDRWLAAYVITQVLTGGCMQQLVGEPLDSAGMYDLLNRIMLEPGVDCATIQKRFNMEGMPLVSTPDELGIAYTETYINTPDQTALRTWYVPAEEDRGVVLLSYGAVGSMPCYLFAVRMLVESGWSVVLYDYRGYGGSSGSADLEPISADLDAVLDWTLENAGHDQVTLMGISLGTIPSVPVAAKRSDVINGVILDSPVVMSHEVRRFGPILGKLVQSILRMLPFELLSEDAIQVMPEPVLFFSAGKDLLTPPAMVEFLFERAPGPKYLVTFDGIGHARGIFLETERYGIELESFLARVWEGREPSGTAVPPPTE